MIERALALCARAAVERPRAVFAAIVVPALIATALIPLSPTDLSFTGIMNRDNVEVARYFDTTRRLDMGGWAPVLLEGPDDRLEAAAQTLKDSLEPLDAVRHVVVEPPTEWLEQNAPYWVERPIFDAWLGIATEPENVEHPKVLEAAIDKLDAQRALLRPEGIRLIHVTMAKDPLDLEAGGAVFLDVQAAAAAALADFPEVNVEFTGLPAIAAQDQSKTLKSIQMLTPVSFLLVLILFRLVEPNLGRVAIVAAPLLLSVGATVGVVGMLTGVITVLESMFGVLVFGLGIDFALHLMVRLRGERARGEPFEVALERTLVGTGRGVVAGAVTTVGAFTIVGLAPDPIAFHLGTSGAIGLLLCLVFMLTLLPVGWAVLEKRSPDTAPPPALKMRAVTALASWSVRHPGATLGLTVVVVGIAAAGAPRFTFETDLSRVFNRDVPAIVAAERVQKLFNLNSAPWTAVATDLDDAMRIQRAWEQDANFAQTESAADLIHADAAERKAKIVAAAEQIDAQIKTMAALEELSTDDEKERLVAAGKALALLKRAGSAEVPTLEALPLALKQRFVGPKGELVVYGYHASTTLDGFELKLLRESAQKVAPEATGLGALLEAVMVSERPWALWVMLGILAFVFVVLITDLRDPRFIAMALVPVVVGLVCTFGILCWAGVAFNVMTTIVVPLIVGLGVDDGIHVVHRIVEDQSVPADVAAERVGHAVVMTTLTTCTSFGTLLFSNHPGMESMALVLCVGLPVCLLASITTLPALAVLLGAGRPRG